MMHDTRTPASETPASMTCRTASDLLEAQQAELLFQQHRLGQETLTQEEREELEHHVGELAEHLREAEGDLALRNQE